MPNLREVFAWMFSPYHPWSRHTYLHLVDFYGQCREIYHTWMTWVRLVGFLGWAKKIGGRVKFHNIPLAACEHPGSSLMFCFGISSLNLMLGSHN